MDIDISVTRPAVIYQRMIQSIVPRPIAWVSTRSAAGVNNLAPFSFFTGVGSRPPTLLFCPANNLQGNAKDTLRNIQETGEFVVNVVPAAFTAAMVATADELPAEKSEFDAAGLTPKPSVHVSAPGVAESPIQFECTKMQIIPIGDGPGGANIVIGRIVFMSIDDRILNADGDIDPDLLDAVGRMGGPVYCRTTERFHVS